jgi:hypothetical protein|uniref:Uncharacterized protein n=1 Tax=Siphoviridae sp. ctSXZ3 TaxID=2825510 RepID=A0A8S5VF32_9CAUD|nr:MAG TPA: Protein of unknown function (DUF1043) [Siphoviridae sp. ctSXZ3]
MIERIAIFVGGVLLGGVGGFLAGKSIEQRQREEVIQAEVNDFKESWKRTHTKKEKVEKTFNGKTEDELTEEVRAAQEELFEIAEESGYNPTPQDEKTVFVPEHDGDIFAITIAEYTTSPYRTTELSYYVYDDVLAASNGQVVTDPEGVVGDWLDSLRPDEPLYIRNEILEADYEVTWVDDSYERAVLHVRDKIPELPFTDED